jgi:hypothetical protein
MGRSMRTWRRLRLSAVWLASVWVAAAGLAASGEVDGVWGHDSALAQAPDAEEQRLIEAKRVITFLPLQGDRASQLQSAYSKAMEGGGSKHIVLETDLLKRLGGDPTAALADPAQVRAAVEGLRVDAVIVGQLGKVQGKSYNITVTVYDAATGEAAGSYVVDLGAKREVPSKAVEPLRAGFEPLLNQTGKALKEYRERPKVVAVTLTSSPPGATVSRVANGQPEVLGKTPLEVTRPLAATAETWTLTLSGYEPESVTVSLDKAQRYEATLQAVPPPPLPPPPPPPSARRTLPLLDVNVGVDVGLRSLKATVSQGTPMDASVGAYPNARLDVTGFPLIEATDNPWLAGLGVAVKLGFASLNATLPTDPVRAPLPSGSGCVADAGTLTMRCPTTQLDVMAGVTWRALLQADDSAPSGRDLDGMAVGVTVAYSSLIFDVDTNPTYEGHGYQGMYVSASFISPLGLPELRMSAEAVVIPVFTFGSGDMIANWGLRATSGLGLGADLGVSYDYYEGLYAQLGYSVRRFSTQYEGTVCDNPVCDGVRSGSEATDLYQQLGLRLGYRLD